MIEYDAGRAAEAYYARRYDELIVAGDERSVRAASAVVDAWLVERGDPPPPGLPGGRPLAEWGCSCSLCRVASQRARSIR